MYKLESYSNGGALVVNSAGSEETYRATFNAESEQEAEMIVVRLNQEVLLKVLADRRFTVETGGLELPNGLRILTDRENRSTLNDSFEIMKHGLIPDTDWKAVNGWKVVGLAEIELMTKAMAAHVRGCFRGEYTVATAINEAVSIVETEEIDVAALFNAAYNAAYEEVMGAEALAE